MLSASILVVVLGAILITQTVSISSRCRQCNAETCGIDAICNENNKCECPLSKPLGNPRYECHEDDRITCDVIADPVLTGFTDYHLKVNSFCKYILTKIEIPIRTAFNLGTGTQTPVSFNKANPFRNKVSILIVGSNGVSPHGTVYLESVEVKLSLVVGKKERVTLTLMLSASSVAYTFSGISFLKPARVKIGKLDKDACRDRILGKTNLNWRICWDDDLHYYQVEFPLFGNLKLTFRPWNNKTENQVLKPGTSITVDPNMVLFPEPDSVFPYAFCHSPRYDTGVDPYLSECAKLGFSSKDECALYAIFKYGPADQSPMCQKSLDIFQNTTYKVVCIKVCVQILLHFSKCCAANNVAVQDAVYECLTTVASGNKIGVSLLSKLHAPIEGCGLEVERAFKLPIPHDADQQVINEI